MSNSNNDSTKKEDEWKANPKITMRLKKSDDDWLSNKYIVMDVQEVDQNQEQTSGDSK